jgi:DNA-binding GntR family transcriptional regulator
VSGDLAPGRLLSERELISDLDIGRTPLRQALQRLEQEHFLMVVPGGGYLVSEITIDGIMRLYELRRPVEGLSARLAATWATPKDLEQFEDFIYAASQPTKREDGYWHLAMDAQFHDLVAAASRNNYVRTTVNQLFSWTQRVQIASRLNVPRAEDELTFYRDFTQAIALHDPEKAEALMLEHIGWGIDIANGIRLG